MILAAYSQSYTVHSHGHGYVFYVVHLNDIAPGEFRDLSLESFQDGLSEVLIISRPFSRLKLASNKARNMEQWLHLEPSCLFPVASKLSQELDGIHRKVHVHVIEISELNRHLFYLLLIQPAAYHFPRALVQKKHPVLDSVVFAVLLQKGIRVGIEIVCHYKQSFDCCSHCQRTDPAEQVQEELAGLHVLVKDAVSFSLQP